MTIQDILDYVRYTPGNTNVAVLKSMLNQLLKNDDNENSWTVLTEETVVTNEVPDSRLSMGILSYSQIIDMQTIKVTFDNFEYECEVLDGYYYGGWSSDNLQPDFSRYPFFIAQFVEEGTFTIALATENAGTHTIKIEVPQTNETNPTIPPVIDSGSEGGEAEELHPGSNV